MLVANAERISARESVAMNHRPEETVIPAHSRIAAHADGAYFQDAWAIPSVAVERSALAHLLLAARRMPGWIDVCMRLRNRVGRLVGLKDLGVLSDVASDKSPESYAPGDRVGIFTLIENRFDEVLVGDRDRHLDVVLSVHRREHADGRGVDVTVTTVVHIHNRLGRLYMLPVRPMHRRIVPALLARFAEASAAEETAAAAARR